MMAWYVRRLCNRVSDHMAHGAMTPAEPPVQQASSGLTKGDESSILPVLEGLPTARMHSHSYKSLGLILLS